MSDRHLVYVIGEPGIGKSTLVRDLTAAWARHPMPAEPGAPARDLLLDGHRRPVAVELGRRRDAFSGTDALPSAVIGDAEQYVLDGRAADEAPLLLAEGARLANLRFLRAAARAGYAVTLVHLIGPDAAATARRARARRLGVPEQHPGWVKGRRTASANLAEQAVEQLDDAVHLVAVDVDRLTARGFVGSYADAIADAWQRALGRRAA